MTYPAGTFDLKAVQKTIFNWVKSRTTNIIPASQILWRDQSEPLPQRPCVTMKIISGPTQQGYSDGQTFIGGATGSQFIVGGNREMVISVQVFGSSKVKSPSALQLASDLHSSLRLQSTLALLRTGGVSVLIQGEFNNITALEETEFEERAQFDMTVGIAQNIVDDTGIIESVGTISGTYNQEGV